MLSKPTQLSGSSLSSTTTPPLLWCQRPDAYVGSRPASTPQPLNPQLLTRPRPSKTSLSPTREATIGSKTHVLYRFLGDFTICTSHSEKLWPPLRSPSGLLSVCLSGTNRPRPTLIGDLEKRSSPAAHLPTQQEGQEVGTAGHCKDGGSGTCSDSGLRQWSPTVVRQWSDTPTLRHSDTVRHCPTVRHYPWTFTVKSGPTLYDSIRQ